MGQPGDLLLIFADALTRSWKQVIKFKPEGRRGQRLGRRGARRTRHPSVAGERGLNTPAELPFEDSRRLTGPNLYFADSGAVLQTLGPHAADPQAHAAWRARVQQMSRVLGWSDTRDVVRQHPGGATLAFTAPADQLFTATEVNEWAWLTGIGDASFHAPGHAASWDEDSARHTLLAHVAAERNPPLTALLDRARTWSLPVLLDDDTLSLGLGRGGRSWPLAALPSVEEVPWDALHSIPTALVTGSNGKTTTVRLLAAMLRGHGQRCAWSCTDGVYVERARLAEGDYSGPAGARSVLRHPEVEAAVLETARGGILRRGLAVRGVDAAAVTNLSIEHFGEYGIHDLEGLADVKLALARALKPEGVLVLNADDPLLLAKGRQLEHRIAWFAREHDHPALQAHRATNGRTCGVHGGRLLLCNEAGQHDLGPVASMPLSAAGRAHYNMSNIAAAALLAQALGVGIEVIAQVLGRFGASRADNPGRLQRWNFGGLRIVTDYAHNPDGLRGLLELALASRGAGRLALLLGQAGNREPLVLAAAVAVRGRADLVGLEEQHLRHAFVGVDLRRQRRGVGELQRHVAFPLRLQRRHVDDDAAARVGALAQAHGQHAARDAEVLHGARQREGIRRDDAHVRPRRRSSSGRSSSDRRWSS
jgi:cyanophycin synthetase